MKIHQIFIKTHGNFANSFWNSIFSYFLGSTRLLASSAGCITPHTRRPLLPRKNPELEPPGRRLDGITTFERFVLGCIDADFCNQIVIFQHFSGSGKVLKSSRCQGARSQQFASSAVYRAKNWPVLRLCKGGRGANLGKARPSFGSAAKQTNSQAKKYCRA